MNGELHVEDPAVLAALYDPVRYRLYRLLGEPRTVAELAEAVDVPANRLYYHVRKLVARGLVTQVGSRRNGRHDERVYARAAARIRFAGDLDLYPGGLLRGIADELEAGLKDAGADQPGSISYHGPTLAPDTARELEQRLRALVTEYADRVEDGTGARRYGILGVLAPLPEVGGG